jgi:hypothetical protein
MLIAVGAGRGALSLGARRGAFLVTASHPFASMPVDEPMDNVAYG